ncbi:major facilitator superfamily domain-containing protein [Suillus fuscotomentosus]|uniref:Major facilitator superfamily domain-containing protein n=1 Tax=Suillus fuscotomentosus TaxID=1912939 RepID=A0AAD4DXH0_9AGAM|nr:major facilitator superfamily domain-containing protein [Suillus fuscotomentosus]KAG1895762.1 major facilitator superfamily domain-containing protein [Suillus fuscotomentosus]
MSTLTRISGSFSHPDDAATTKTDVSALQNAEGDPHLVVLEPEDNPQNISLFRRWLAVLIISSASLCVTLIALQAAFTEQGSAQTFHVSHEVTILGISLYVSGLGMGPLLVGPLSEVYGRNVVYRVSYALFFILTFPVVFAPNIAVFLIFRFITGFCGSTFLSVAGGSVSDMFPNSSIANPMAVYTISPFIGPVVGPLISGFINQYLYWEWTYRVQLCWIFAELLILVIFIPETYAPVILKKKAKRLRESTGDPKFYAPLDRRENTLVSAVLISCYKPFQLLLFDRMALLLDSWNALVLGILYLAFQAYPIIFEDNHGFDMQTTGLAFAGIGLGMILAISTQPLWNRGVPFSLMLYVRETAKYNGDPPPEMRLIMGQVGAILVPVGLFWLAFTTYPQVHWIAPIIASVPFGSGIYFVFTSTFTYLVTAYRPIAASAMASNSALRSAFAAAFPLFAGAMYDRLGTVGATALLAGLATIMAPLPFIFYRIGARLRKNSRFAAH